MDGEEPGRREGDSWSCQSNIEQRGERGELVGKEEVLGERGNWKCRKKREVEEEGRKRQARERKW